MKRLPSALVVLVLHTVVALLACEDEVMTGSPTPPPPARRPIASASAAASAASSATVPTLSEADFTRSDSNRDPFASYAELLKPAKEEVTRIRTQALADRFALNELKLVGIVTGGTAPRAMFLDPEGKGWIVGLGQLLGRAETVKTGGSLSAEYELTWKVDRIRENDVVFIRETPGRPNVPSATRVVSLHTEENESRRRLRLLALLVPERLRGPC
jgi:type IV pilus assembly protein PilP